MTDDSSRECGGSVNQSSSMSNPDPSRAALADELCRPFHEIPIHQHAPLLKQAGEAIRELLRAPLPGRLDCGTKEALKPFAKIGLWQDSYPDGPDILTDQRLQGYFAPADVRRAREAVAAIPPTLNSGAGWQPIKTAPLDGSNVLVCRSMENKSVGEAFFYEGAWRTWDGENHTRTSWIDGYLTHWRPLPPAESLALPRAVEGGVVETWAYIERLLHDECGLMLDCGIEGQRANCINAIQNGPPDQALMAAAIEFLNTGEGLHKIRVNGKMMDRKQFAAASVSTLLEERERCAKIAERIGAETGDGEGEIYIARKIADAIRAPHLRPQPSDGGVTGPDQSALHDTRNPNVLREMRGWGASQDTSDGGVAGEPVAWKPIETAPKDGTEVDLWCVSLELDGRATDCAFRDGAWCWRRNNEEWQPFMACEPSHWMPIPADPSAPPVPGNEGRETGAILSALKIEEGRLREVEGLRMGDVAMAFGRLRESIRGLSHSRSGC